ncbi:MAG: S8 family serine peptidase [Bacilli bacterium]|nr:S8 family serine peptidase [Bacilli bacterium]
MKNLLKRTLILFVTLTILSSLFTGCSSRNNNDNQPEETYKLNELISSIDEKVEVEVQEKLVSASEILAEEQHVIVYRPKDGIYEFPTFINPEKIKVDKYGNFLLSYNDEEIYLKDYSNLQDSKKTEFAVKLANNDLIVEDVISDEEICSTNSNLSYIPKLMNTEEYAKDVSDSQRKLTVVIMDTGMYNKNSTIAPYINIADSYDFVNMDSNVFDEIDDHATYVGNTILDTVGKDVMSKVNLINAKMLENGMGSIYDAANAVMHYADKGVDIINCSWSANGCDSMMKYALDYAASKGVILICSTGNDASVVSHPAVHENAIAVSAIDSNKYIAYFSNIGSEVDFTAPGVSILTGGPNNEMAYVNGTSFSAPAITGFSILSMLDDVSIDTKEDLTAHLISYCEDLGQEGKDDLYGYGLPIYEKIKEPETTKEYESVTKPETTRNPETTTKSETTKRPETTTMEETTKVVETTTAQHTTKKPEEITTKAPETTTQPTTKAPETTTQPTTKAPKPTTQPPTTKEQETTKAPEEETTVKKEKTFTISFNANGGNVDTISKTVTNNSTYGKLPTPYRDYYVFDGWYTAPKDGNKITESSKVSLSKNQTLYAHWKLKNESDWVKVSDVPKGAMITDEKYKYTLTSYKTSSSKTLSGWTLYDTKISYGNYGGWSGWSTTPINSSDTRKVETKQEKYTYYTGRKEFNYSHYKYYNTTYNKWYYTYSYAAAAANGHSIVYEELGWSTVEQYLYTKFGNSSQSWGTYVNSQPWFNEMVREQTATGVTTYYRYADRTKTYTYYFKKDEVKESKDNPTGKENVSNVTKYVKYVLK